MDDLNLQESIPESFGKDLADFNLSASFTGKNILKVQEALTPEVEKPENKEDVLIETFGKVCG